MTTARQLDHAILLAVQAHAEQVDKAGLPYILHPLRVMNSVHPHGLDAMAVAVLHDVLEDTKDPAIWLSMMQQVLPAEVITAVQVLTKVAGEKYETYLERVSCNELARRVKLADMHDNLTRIDSVPSPETRLYLAEKYRRGISYLLGGADASVR